MSPTPRGSVVLALDTATREAVVAVAGFEGPLLAAERWVAGHLHGERLLASTVRVLEGAGLALADVGAIIVGTGPGSFTGMRVGLATAKGLAFGLDVPIVGVGTAEALGAAGSEAPAANVVVLQPAGPGGRYVTVLRSEGAGRATLTEGPTFAASADEVTIPEGARILAVDVDGGPAAVAAGAEALARLPETLMRLGRDRLTSAGPDDLAELVPAYVTLPRGAAAAVEGIAWSPARP